MIVNALAGKPLPIYGDGLQVRDWLYVERPLQRHPRGAGRRPRSARSTTSAAGTRSPTATSCDAVCALLDELRPDPAGPLRAADHASSTTAPATTAATPSTRARSSANSAGARPRPSRPASARPCSGTWTTPTGWPMCRAAPTATGWPPTTPRDDHEILLLGCKGQVGWELQRSLAPLGELVACDFDTPGELKADFSDSPRRWPRWCGACSRSSIVNAAAHTAVDKAESEPELARAINATAPGVLAREAAALGRAAGALQHRLCLRRQRQRAARRRRAHRPA